MNTFLKKIMQLDATSVITLLSNQGKVLYCGSGLSTEDTQNKMDTWYKLLNLLEKPISAQFDFDDGSCYICHIGIGYIFIYITEKKKLYHLHSACLNLQLRFQNPMVRRKTLLRMLEEVEGVQQAAVIDELSTLGNEEVARALLPLLEDYSSIDELNQDDVLVHICQTLGHCRTYPAAVGLNEFLTAYLVECAEPASRVVDAAKVSIMQLELGHLAINAELPWEEMSQDSFPSFFSTNNLEDSDDEQKADSVPQVISEEKRQEAVESLLTYVEEAANQGNFDQAEILKEKIISIDWKNHTEIDRAYRIINDAKYSLIKPADLETWQSLVNVLNKDEFASLYHVMTPRYYDSGEMIVQQGAYQPQLFFVNSGEVDMYTIVDDEEYHLKTITAGEVIEGGCFFEASVWTVNVRSSGADVFVLSHRNLSRLCDEFPSITAKLKNFCGWFITPSNLIRQTGKSRRKFERNSISGKAQVTLLDQENNNQASGIKGDLFDISEGGLAFHIRSTKKGNANMLLNKKIHVALDSENSGEGWDGDIGTIVAVRGHHSEGNEYSVHVQFDQRLHSSVMQQFSALKIL